MVASRCFRDSKGRLGCVSCHDPHRLPPAGTEPAYYRDRCLACHKEASCTEQDAARKAKADACAGCHMPRLNETDVVHIAVTDHRILRRASDGAVPAGPPPRVPLVPFHRGPHAPGERDLGIALADLAGLTPPGPGRGYLGGLAARSLQTATEETPDDVAAWERLGHALRHQGRPKEALDAYESALTRVPKREAVLAAAAEVAGQLDRSRDAEDYWRRALEVSPRRPDYHAHRARLLSERRQNDQALAECEQAVRLNPASVNVRLTQVACLLDAGRKDEARAAFAVLMALKPPRADELKRWFEDQLR
jgi:predicted CXXCH cytochrome family protein